MAKKLIYGFGWLLFIATVVVMRLPKAQTKEPVMTGIGFYTQRAKLPKANSVPFLITLEVDEVLRDVDFHPITDADLARIIKDKGTNSDEIAIRLGIGEELEDKVSAQQLANAVNRIEGATSTCGEDSVRKLRLDIVIEGKEKAGVHR